MFEPGFHSSARPGARCLLVRVRGDLVAVEEAPLPGRGHFLGHLDGLPCVAVEEEVAEGTAATATGVEAGFVGLRQLWAEVDEPVWAMAGRAVQIVAWDGATNSADVAPLAQSPCPTNAPGGAQNAA